MKGQASRIGASDGAGERGMRGEWQEQTWGDLATLEYGKALRGYRESEGSYRVYGTNGPIGWHDEPLCPHPSVIVGRKGAYRGIHFSPKPFFVIDTAFYLKPKCEFDIKWAYYELLTHDINSMDSGSAIPSTSRDSFYRLPVLIPPLYEQRAIASILGTLDDKIELNCQMNATLEAIGQAIFKHWFVDFEFPNEDGKPYRSSGGEMVDSELGEVPGGWGVGKLSDLCSTQYGYTTKAVERPVGPKFLRVKDINKRNWIEWDEVPYCEIESNKLDNYRLQVGDVVVARMADPGKSAIVEDDVDAVFASYLVRLKTASLSHAYYVYGFMKSRLYFKYAEGAKSGSVQSNMNAKVIVGANLVIPPDELIQLHLEAVLPLRQKMVDNVRESVALAAIRDALLPKLMSGEIRVNVEREE